MNLQPASPADVVAVARNMRAVDFEEMSATSWAASRTDLADELAARFGSVPGVYAIGLEGAVVAILAAVTTRPRTLGLGLFATEAWPAVARPLSRWARFTFRPQVFASDVQRMEAVSLDRHAEAHRWLGWLGLHRESEIPKFGKNGETFVMFSWVAP